MQNFGLYTDLYQLTMGQCYFDTGHANTIATFTVQFRNYPFNGGYAVFCGNEQIRDLVEGFYYNDDDIKYLAGLKDAGNKNLFSKDFLSYLKNLRMSIDVDCACDGTVVFPYEPIVRVTGPIIECQLIETALLNCVNFETLVATKAARVCASAKGRPVAEFGLRRAQGTGGMWASKASIVGGCASTSNVAAGFEYKLPVSGTHAHSWVMMFDDELEAFRQYARIYPGNCTLLIDTYNIKQGIKNAIVVGLEMKERGEVLAGVRIDSGDLSWGAKYVRQKLDEAGLTETKIVLSNDLDEHTIASLIEEGTPVDAFGVGTKLAACEDCPTLGGVFKLSGIKDADGAWIGKIKVSESVEKTTVPGFLNVRRYVDGNGKLAGDMVFDESRGANDDEIIEDPLNSLRHKALGGFEYSLLLEPLMRCGVCCFGEDDLRFDVLKSRDVCKKSLETLDVTQKRILNPHTYPVGLDIDLADVRVGIIRKSI